MPTGTVTLNGISDAELIMILKEKEKVPSMTFPPNLMSQGTTQRAGMQQPIPTSPAIYNNCQLSWTSDDGIKAVYSILHKLIHGHDKDPAVP